MLCLIGVTAAVHTLDRTMISILIEPVKRDLHLSDSQVGLLTGMIFAFFYTFSAIPIARYADRAHRPRILATAVGLWTVMTTLCGTAANLWQMVFFRAGVAVGEAGFAPVSQSIVASAVPPEKRAGALSVIAAGGSAGVMLGMIVGGFLAQNFGWRSAYIIVGLAGIPLAILIGFTIREPRLSVVQPPAEQRGSLLDAIRTFGGNRTIVLLALSAMLCVMSTYSITVWKPALMMRSYGLSISHAGLALGLTVGVASVGGTLGWGYLANIVGRERALLIPIICFAVAAPLSTVAFLMPKAEWTLAILVVTTILGTSWYGAIFAAIHARVTDDNRSIVVAGTFFLIGMIGNGFGPTIIGVGSDFMEPLWGKASLRYVMIVMANMQLVAALLLFLAHRSLTGRPQI